MNTLKKNNPLVVSLCLVVVAVITIAWIRQEKSRKTEHNLQTSAPGASLPEIKDVKFRDLNKNGVAPFWYAFGAKIPRK